VTGYMDSHTWRGKSCNIWALPYRHNNIIQRGIPGKDCQWFENGLVGKIEELGTTEPSLEDICWIRSVANGGIVITIVTIESWGGLV
jgi:hypothetical protein